MVLTEELIDKSSIFCYNLLRYKITKTMQTPESVANSYQHKDVLQEASYRGAVVIEQAHDGAVIDLHDRTQPFTDPLELRGTSLQIVGVGPDGHEASVFITPDAIIGQARGARGELETHLEARLPGSPFIDMGQPIVIGEPWESPLGRLDQISAVRKELMTGPMGFEDHRDEESPFALARQVVQSGLRDAVLHELPAIDDSKPFSGEALLQIERNRALLASFESGHDLLPAYEAALRANPRVADIRIIASTEHYGKARQDNAVELRLGGRAEIEEAFGALLGNLPALQAEIAEQLDMPEDEVTLRVARMQNMLHEFGHVLDYMDRGAALVSQQRAEEMETLPLGSVPASELLRQDNPRRQELDQRYAPDEVAALISQQARAYRHIKAESTADRFAATVLRANPDLLKEAQ